MNLELEDLKLIENTLLEREEKIRNLRSYHHGWRDTHEKLDRVKDVLNKIDILITGFPVDPSTTNTVDQ